MEPSFLAQGNMNGYTHLYVRGCREYDKGREEDKIPANSRERIVACLG